MTTIKENIIINSKECKKKHLYYMMYNKKLKKCISLKNTLLFL